MALLAIGLNYDASDRLFGSGKGLYSAVILCSTPALGMAAGDPGWLSVLALFMFQSVALWFAAAASGDNRVPLLVMLCMVLAGCGVLIGNSAIALIFAIPAALAASKSTKPALVFGIAVVSFEAGAVVGPLVTGNTMGGFIVAPILESSVIVLTCTLPWLAWLVPSIIQGQRMELLLAACIAAAVYWMNNIAIVVITAAPATALLVSRRFQERISNPGSPLTRAIDSLGGLALLSGGIALSMLSRSASTGPSSRADLIGIAVILLSLLIAISAVRGQARWAFGLTVVAGLLSGATLWQSTEAEFGQAGGAPNLNLGFAVGAVSAFVVWMAYRRYYGRPIPRALLARFREHSFANENFRRFAEIADDGWGGASIRVAEPEANNFSVVLFGDITGSDSPVSSRKGGYVVYRRLAQTLNALDIAFAISLGDLASRARELPYRRLRRMLRHIRVPLTVVPGNHDVFDGKSYDLRYFHALFGADNSHFRHGPVQFILLNNAWGHLESAQWEWLDNTLESSEATWRLLCCHKPPFDPRPETLYAMENREHAERLHALCVRHRVSAVFSGHIHALLDESRDDVHYIISGGGGSRLVAEGAEHHYLLLRASDRELSIEALPISGSARRDQVEPLFQLRLKS